MWRRASNPPIIRQQPVGAAELMMQNKIMDHLTSFLPASTDMTVGLTGLSELATDILVHMCMVFISD